MCFSAGFSGFSVEIYVSLQDSGGLSSELIVFLWNFVVLEYMMHVAGAQIRPCRADRLPTRARICFFRSRPIATNVASSQQGAHFHGPRPLGNALSKIDSINEHSPGTWDKG